MMDHRKNFFQYLFLSLALLTLASCSASVDCDTATDTDACLRVLFVGNSYTMVNDLPGTFSKLAGSGDHPVEVGMAANGGWGFTDHVEASETLAAIQSQAWDYVVLQERSLNPVFSYSRKTYMYPAARTLVKLVRETGAKPIFFVTWGYRDGYPEEGILNYVSMQAQVDQGYLALAQELNVTLAPVGTAWYITQKSVSPPDLWQEDGSHPTPAGTYLAACVFYASIFNESPQGLPDLGMVSAEIARQLQDAAARTVLGIQ